MKKRVSNLLLKTKHLKEEPIKTNPQSKKKKWFKRILFTLLGLSLVGGITVFSFLAYIYSTLPPIDDPEAILAVESSVILDRNGEVLYNLHGDENREVVPFEEISPHAVLAIMAIEDDKFYEHPGYDIPAILRAACSEVGVCSQPRGGSTITQQFIKNAFLSNERTYTRKIKEIMLAIQLEKKYSKDEIMALYLNRINFGGNFYGIETAANAYFGKHASELTLAESAILASLPNDPTELSPYGPNVYASINLEEQDILDENLRSEEDIRAFDPTLIKKGLIGKTYTFGEGDKAREIYIRGRANFVLDRMLALNYIDQKEYDEAKEEADNIVFKEYKQEIKAPHFVMYVREMLESLELEDEALEENALIEFPELALLESVNLTKEQIEGGGLRITTTLDYNMQKIGEEVVASHGEANEANFNINNAALISVVPDTGEIMTMVGSRDYWNEDIDGNVNVTVNTRQPGSSFKPIVYAAAFTQGYAPSTVVYDVRTTFGGWTPKNFNGTFSGPVSMRQALGASLNIPAIKAGDLAGMENVLALARNMGIELNQPDDWYGLPATLGTGDAKPLDMALAYSTFANGGYKVDPIAILKIEDSDGNIIYEYKEKEPEEKEQILDPQVAYLVHDVLADKSARPGAFWQNQLDLPDYENGAKTGTSTRPPDANGVVYPQDGWTIGYVRNLSTAVWTGNSRGEALGLNANGLEAASPIWKEFMTEAVKFVEKEGFEEPEGITWVKISKRTGKLPSKNTPPGDIISAMFASFSVPTEYDNSYQVLKIDSVSGKLATEFTPEDAIIEKAFFTHNSIRPDNPQWQSAVRAWAKANGQDEQPPTEYDDVHTAETMNNPPNINIISPQSQSTVSPPVLSIVTQIDSSAGVDRVDYYLDGEFIKSLTDAPFNTNIPISANLETGSSHTVKVILYDEILRSSQSSITFKIGSDSVPPTASFVYPKNNQALIAGAKINVNVEAYDANGGIASIKYYLDGSLQKNDTTGSGGSWQLTVPSEGSHELSVKVTDHSGNTSTESITIQSESEDEGPGGESRITSPGSNSTFEENKNINVQGFISNGDRQSITSVSFQAKKAGQVAQEIGSASASPGSSTYSVTWQSPPAGTYELYMKVTLSDGTVRFTSRVPVVIGNAIADDSAEEEE